MGDEVVVEAAGIQEVYFFVVNTQLIPGKHFK